jgi:hypothetical protein
MRVKYDDLVGCEDCRMYIANGDIPENRPNLPRAIAAQWPDDGPHIVCGDTEGDEFSWQACDICGSRLGGARYPFAILEP